MAETRFVKSADHVRIAYDVSGEGPALLLLHGGFIQNRKCWHEAGYVDRLSKEYRVIAIDLRGHGESDRPITPEAYALDNLIEDIRAVLAACNVNRFYLWGYSLGGTLGLQIASRVKEAMAAILVGVWFGKLFPLEVAAMVISRIKAVEKARVEGVFDKMEMTPLEKDLFSRVDLDFYKAISLALPTYPPVEPAQLLCPVLIVAGTANQLAFSKLKEREDEIRTAGARVRFFDGLDHAGELSEIDTVLPECLSFLRDLQ
jgi:pimeloyl-ACP methyl ester carboxylesterase